MPEKHAMAKQARKRARRQARRRRKEYALQRKAEYLDSSFPFNENLKCSSGDIEELLSGMKLEGHKLEEKKLALRIIFANLILAAFQNAPFHLSTASSGLPIGYDVLQNQILPLLEEANLIKIHIGFRRRRERKQTRIEATELFKERFAGLINAVPSSPDNLSIKLDEVKLVKKTKITKPVKPKRKPLIAKGGKIRASKTKRKEPKTITVIKKRDLPYIATPKVKAIKENLKKINSVLLKHRFSNLPHPDDPENLRELLYPVLHRSFSPSDEELKNTNVRKEYSFEYGGRFYSSTDKGYLGIEKELRATIKIDGKKSIEKDFCALHIMMLYAMEGIQYEGYPYAKMDDSIYKPLLKYTLLSMLNAKTEEKSIQSLNNSLHKDWELKKLYDKYKKEFSVKKTTEIIERLKDTFSEISKYFGSGIGVKLQYKDSCIAEKVLLHFTDKGIPVLPVHDSFIIPEEHEKELVKVMKKAYKSVMGGFSIDVETSS